MGNRLVSHGLVTPWVCCTATSFHRLLLLDSSFPGSWIFLFLVLHHCFGEIYPPVISNERKKFSQYPVRARMSAKIFFHSHTWLMVWELSGGYKYRGVISLPQAGCFVVSFLGRACCLFWHCMWSPCIIRLMWASYHRLPILVSFRLCLFSPLSHRPLKCKLTSSGLLRCSQDKSLYRYSLMLLNYLSLWFWVP